MIEECGIEKRYYIAYRIGSQMTHGGPAVADEIWETREIRKTGEVVLCTKGVNYPVWGHLFPMASWCIANPGQMTLIRSEAPEQSVDKLLADHNALLAVSARLLT